MFYGKESIEERINLLSKVVSGVVVIPAPKYTNNESWNDELRTKHGYTKLEDGSWATVIDAQDYLDKMKKDMIEVFEEFQNYIRKNNLLRAQKYEMEYGLRVAQKSLNKALNMKGDDDGL